MTNQHERSQLERQVLLSLLTESSRTQGFQARRDAVEPGMEHLAKCRVASSVLLADVPLWNAARYYAVYTDARIRFSCLSNKNLHSTSGLVEDLLDRAKLVWSGHLVLNRCGTFWSGV